MFEPLFLKLHLQIISIYDVFLRLPNEFSITVRVFVSLLLNLLSSSVFEKAVLIVSFKNVVHGKAESPQMQHVEFGKSETGLSYILFMISLHRIQNSSSYFEA